jgi:hypothetical protein
MLRGHGQSSARRAPKRVRPVGRAPYGGEDEVVRLGADGAGGGSRVPGVATGEVSAAREVRKNERWLAREGDTDLNLADCRERRNVDAG